MKLHKHIRDLHAKGLSAREIADQINPRPSRPIPEEMKPQHVWALHAQGLSAREIADQLGMSVQSVNNRLSRPIPEDMKSQQARDLHAQGLSIPEIAQRLDVSTLAVPRLLALMPRSLSNPDRDHLIQQTWHIRCQLGINWTAAARRVIAQTPLDVLTRASPNKWPVTSLQLANWSRPKE